MNSSLLRHIGVFSILVASGLAFEIDGLKSGMSYEEAREVIARKAPEGNLKFHPESGILVWGFGPKATHISSVTFVNSKVALYSKGLPPEFSRFVALVKSFQDKLGEPSTVYPFSADPAYPQSGDQLTIAWRRELEQTAIKYGPGNLSIVYTDFAIAPELKLYAP